MELNPDLGVDQVKVKGGFLKPNRGSSTKEKIRLFQNSGLSKGLSNRARREESIQNNWGNAYRQSVEFTIRIKDWVDFRYGRC